MFLFLSLSSLSYADLNQKILVIPKTKSQAQKTKKKQYSFETTQISEKDINNATVVKLTTLLKQKQSIARIEAHSGDMTQTSISIRGFGDNASTNSLIMIDGFPLTNPSLITPNLNLILLSDLKYINIFQGSRGSLWGDQAVGGTMNIVTKKPQNFIFENKISTGSFATHFFSSALGNHFPQGYFKLSGFSYQTQHDRAHSKQKTLGFFPQAGYNYTKGNIDLKWQYVKDEAQFPGGLTEEEYIKDPKQATQFSNFIRYHINNLQLLSQHDIYPNWLIETRLNYQTMQGKGLMGSFFHRQEGSCFFYPKLIGSLYSHKIILGYFKQYQYYQFTNSLTKKLADTKQEDFFAHIELNSFFSVHPILGMRYARQDSNFRVVHSYERYMKNRAFVKEYGLIAKPDFHWQMFIRRDENFRFPKTNEALWLPINVDTLQTQQGISYETGIHWQNDTHDIQLTFYQLDIQNEIVFDPEQTIYQPFGTFHQFDKTKRNGVTGTYHYHINNNISMNTQLNYVNAQLVSGSNRGKAIPAVPAWNGNIGFDYQLTSYFLK